MVRTCNPSSFQQWLLKNTFRFLVPSVSIPMDIKVHEALGVTRDGVRSRLDKVVSIVVFCSCSVTLQTVDYSGFCGSRVTQSSHCWFYVVSTSSINGDVVIRRLVLDEYFW